MLNTGPNTSHNTTDITQIPAVVTVSGNLDIQQEQQQQQQQQQQHQGEVDILAHL